ncbi:hypothetical protein BZG36_02573 [Bifiguratus adelaidae]|uniref:F-box domain-containing protein n=1 Tax=Bifiguratus adelaidae TaxID=1938954 RepID=A0A261Y127_9FUNG|nr:hypothetical protein BZG36_02573 [Bifiguratus adelaidae]
MSAAKTLPSERRRDLAKLADESEELHQLQANMQKLSALSDKMMGVLGSFDSRLGNLERSILPIHKSTQKLTLLADNIDKTLQETGKIVKSLDLVSIEEKTILKGPNEEDIIPYLQAMARIRDGLQYLEQCRLPACDKAMGQLRQLLKAGMLQLESLFRKWLTAASDPMDAHVFLRESSPASSKPDPKLSQLSTYITTSSKETGYAVDFTKPYVDIRSLFLQKSLSSLGQGSLLTERQQGSSYEKGSGGYIKYTDAVLRMFMSESKYVIALLSSPTHRLTAFHGSLQLALNEYTSIGRQLNQTIRRNPHNDIFLLLDVLEHYESHWKTDWDDVLEAISGPGLSLIPQAQSQRGEVSSLMNEFLSNGGRSFIDFADEVKGRREKDIYSSLAADGTVHELTSNTLSYLKRLLEYTDTVTALLLALGNGGWNNPQAMTTFQNLSAWDALKVGKERDGREMITAFYVEILDVLVQTLQQKSKGYRKPALTAIFLLNNFHHIAKQVRQVPLSSILDESVEQKFARLVRRQLDTYQDSWKPCVENLMDITYVKGGSLKTTLNSADKQAIKDKFKNFNTEFEDIYRSQKAYAIPDPDLRSQLIRDIKKVLLPLYSRFLERYQNSDFSKNTSKYIRWSNEQLEHMVNGLFEPNLDEEQQQGLMSEDATHEQWTESSEERVSFDIDDGDEDSERYSRAYIFGSKEQYKKYRWPFMIVLALLITGWFFWALQAIFYPHETARPPQLYQFRDIFNKTYDVHRERINWLEQDDRDDLYVYQDTNSSDIMFESVINGNSSTFVSASALHLDGKPLDYYDFSISADGEYVLFTVNRTKQKTLVPLTPANDVHQKPSTSLAIFSPVGHDIAYVSGNNLFVTNLKTHIQVTDDGDKNTFNGLPDWVYEEEVFGNDAALWWSPDATHVAYLRFNETEVPEYTFPLYMENENSSYPENVVIKYPKAGAPNPVVDLYIYSLLNNSTQKIVAPAGTPSDPTLLFADDNRIISQVQWMTDSHSHLLFKQSNRVQDHEITTLVTLNPVASHTAQVVRENKPTDGGWVDMASNAQFIPATSDGPGPAYIDIVDDGNGYMHLALFEPLNATEPKLWLTKGEFEVIDGSVVVDTAKGRVYFTSTEESSIERHLYSVSYNQQVPERTCMTCAKDSNGNRIPGYFSAFFSPKATYYTLNCDGPGVPWQKIKQVDDPKFTKVLNLNSHLRNFTASLSLPTRRFLTVDAGSFQMNAMEILPPNFNPKIPHPVLFRVYGGPRSQLVSQRWALDWQTYVASRFDAVVVTVDGRGTGFKGRKFRSPVSERLGELETLDQITAARHWSQLEYVDKERMAIWGWSYGGYMTSKVVEADSGLFSTAMAVAPVTDWHYYDSIYTERYMKTPEMNPEGYSKSAVKKMTGFNHVHYLLVHGLADDNVHFQNSAVLVDRLTQAQVEGYRVHYYTDNDHAINSRNANPELYYLLTDHLYNSFGGTKGTSTIEKPANLTEKKRHVTSLAEAPSQGIQLVQLPEEVLMLICRHVGPAELPTVALTCRALHRICQADLVWRDIIEDEFGPRVLDITEPLRGQKSFRDLFINDLSRPIARSAVLDCDIAWKNSRHYWNMIPEETSVFGEAAYLRLVFWFDVNVIIRNVPPGEYDVEWRVRLAPASRQLGRHLYRWTLNMLANPLVDADIAHLADPIAFTTPEIGECCVQNGWSILKAPTPLLIRRSWGYTHVRVALENKDSNPKHQIMVDGVRLVKRDFSRDGWDRIGVDIDAQGTSLA